MYVEYRGWKYCWRTTAEKDPPYLDKPWKAWVQAQETRQVQGYPLSRSGQTKVIWFAKRASAKRRSLRMKETHIRRNAQQRKRSLCSKCLAHVKRKDDYLCTKCRYG
jgi:hypothetical protein